MTRSNPAIRAAIVEKLGDAGRVSGASLGEIRTKLGIAVSNSQFDAALGSLSYNPDHRLVVWRRFWPEDSVAQTRHHFVQLLR